MLHLAIYTSSTHVGRGALDVVLAASITCGTRTRTTVHSLDDGWFRPDGCRRADMPRARLRLLNAHER